MGNYTYVSALVSALFLYLFSAHCLALSGRVTDVDGAPIAGATVELIGLGINLSTDSDGRFSSEHDDVEEIHLEAKGFTHKVVHIHEFDEKEILVELGRSALEQVDVYGLPLHASVMESAQPISVISDDALRNRQASTLGETLKSQIGVHSSYFGPVSSSPIIRGLDGPRVLITQNGLDAGDASRVGPDHVVSTESTTATQIEILRGPSTLFYGSGAIGGVVNIVDDRVPSGENINTSYSAQYNTVSNEREASAAHSNVIGSIAYHVDGFWRDGDNYSIPDDAFDSDDNNSELENSASQSEGFNLGGSTLFDAGYIGLSYGHLSRVNGIPGHSHEEHDEDEHDDEEHDEEEHDEEEHGEEQVQSDMTQDRWQMISEINVDNRLISELHTRIGFTDYEHTELHVLESGGTEIATQFYNETLQARVDMLHQELSHWRGAFSIDAKQVDFKAVGEEAFTAPSTTRSFAVAVMEERHSGDYLWQLGARIESTTIEAEPLMLDMHHEEEHQEEDHHDEQLPGTQQRFTPLSLSAGMVWDVMPQYKISAALTHAQRAPSAAELYSLGPHIGAGSFEVGALYSIHQEDDELHLDYNDQAKIERSNNIDLSFRKHEGNFGFLLNAYYNQIDNFYFQQYTGYTTEDLLPHDEIEAADTEQEHHHEEALPVYIFRQADSTLYGVEFDLAWQLNQKLKWRIWGDSIRGELNNGENLPRIPPARLGNTLEVKYNKWFLELNSAYNFEQDTISQNETTTDAYHMVDAMASYGFSDGFVVFVKINNMLDELGFVHSSFIKEEAPLPGRAYSVGIRGSF
ncbi:iron complex outermembrane recepter protein [Alteromonadaceae bacterium Bs31]|nr:iron complex outermembrane recepter protein [Alteromonadaceae bacterium Bs31]